MSTSLAAEALEDGLGAGVGLLKVDAPIAQFFERDKRAGHGATDVRPGAQDANVAIEILHLRLRRGGRGLFQSVHGGFVPDNEERRRLLSYDGTPEAMRAILRANFHDPAWAQDDAYVKRRVEASLAPGAWEAIAAARLKPPTVPPRSDFGQPDTIAYERIPYPTLAVAGAEDKLRLPGYHEALGRIRDSRIVVLAEAGHLLNIEKAGEFNGLVRQFLVAGDAEGEADG